MESWSIVHTQMYAQAQQMKIKKSISESQGAAPRS